jgi:hypothetical protein
MGYCPRVLGNHLIAYALLGVLPLGLIVLVRGVVGDRARGRVRCPRCWYDMAGTAGLVCPECGKRAGSPRALRRTHRRWRMAGAGLLVMAAGATGAWWPWVRHTVPRMVLPAYVLESRLEVTGGYVVRVLAPRFRDDVLERRLEIRRHGRVVFSTDSIYIKLGASVWPALPGGPGPGAKPPGLGDDVTGRGVPDLVVEFPTGGSGGNSTTMLFELGDERSGGFKVIGTLPTGTFADMDGDGRPEFVAVEQSLAYRWSPNAGSPRPLVILRYRSDHFVPAADLMIRPPMTEAEVSALVARSADEKIPEEERFLTVLKTVIDLIYHGQAEQAWQVLETAWPNGPRDKAKFGAELKAALAQSPWVTEIELLQLESSRRKAGMEAGAAGGR